MSKSTQKTYNSSFWMGEWDDDISYVPKSKLDVKSDNLYKLASYKRAIGNFVSIVTSQQIPVRFSTSGDSYTDGKSVTISSKLDTPKEFDVAVGLALHEGSHIKLSDFELLSQLDSIIGSYVSYDVLEKCEKLGISARVYLKMILNYVEDRRIDQYIYDTAPGYRDYYRALYDKYFNDTIIDKGLNSDEYTDETLESYMFRLINLHSEYSRLSTLKNLRKIYEVIDLGNISRLKTSEDALGVATNVFQLIIEALEISDSVEEEQPQKSEKSTDESEDSENNSPSNQNGDESDDSDEGEDDENDSGGASMEWDGEDSKDSSSDTKLTDKQKKQLEGKIKKQEDFINGNVSKKKISKKDLQTITVIDESKTEIEVVGSDVIPSGVQCIVVRKLTQSLLESSEFPYTYMGYNRDTKSHTLYPYNTQSVSDGIRMGTILGKKLQTRSESRETVFNRQRNGRLDKRMVSSLGFGNEQVFFTREVDKYKKANLHISIDASGSMGGSKWNKTIATTVALAKAVDMIPNLEIQISLRSTSKNDLPYIVMVYDSRVDKFSKVKSVFPYLYPSGTTPEGLTFEAIHKEMVPQSSEVDSYFLNFSDGEPYYSNSYGYYRGSTAATHTYKQIKRMKQSGISVLSYFISEYGNGSNRIFSESYKDSASFVDVSNMNSVVKTMNKLFMKKDG